MIKQYVSLNPVVCKKIPLRNGEPLPFEIGKAYDFAQMGRVFVYYKPDGRIRRTDIIIGRKQFKECFE